MNESLKKTLYAGLQYNLRMIRGGETKSRVLNTGNGTSTNWVGIKTALRYDFKPILFSLDQLTKYITIGGETFVPLYKLSGVDPKEVSLRDVFDIGLNKASYNEIQKLHEWHFNVFNLKEDQYIKAEDGQYY